MPNQSVIDSNKPSTDKFRMTYDTSTPDTLNTAYMRARLKISLPTDIVSYPSYIHSLRKHIENCVDSELKQCRVWHRNHITMVDISDKGLRYRDTCFLKYELHLRPSSHMDWDTMQWHMAGLAARINEKVVRHLEACRVTLP